MKQNVARKQAERGIKTDRALHPREILERAQHLERRVSAVWLPIRVDYFGAWFSCTEGWREAYVLKKGCLVTVREDICPTMLCLGSLFLMSCSVSQHTWAGI